MLYTLEAVRDNLRNRDGKRVFYLGQGDTLTVSAREYLQKERIEILPAAQARPDRYRLENGGFMEGKPEDMTHLNGNTLVSKTHPRIIFRGAMDTLESLLLLGCQYAPQYKPGLTQVWELAGEILACEVLEKPLVEKRLGGMTEAELRSRSHRPQDFYGQPHFRPGPEDGEALLWLNRIRCAVRAAELKAVAAIPGRKDILQAMNRMSSFLYLLMVQEKAKGNKRS